MRSKGPASVSASESPHEGLVPSAQRHSTALADRAPASTSRWPLWDKSGGTERSQPVPPGSCTHSTKPGRGAAPLLRHPGLVLTDHTSIPLHTLARAAAKLGLPKPLAASKAPRHRRLAYHGQQAHPFPPKEQPRPPPLLAAAPWCQAAEHPSSRSSPGKGSADSEPSQPCFGAQPGFRGAETAPAAGWAGSGVCKECLRQANSSSRPEAA